MKNYYNDNKDRIKHYQKSRLYCMCCDKYITKWNISKHKKRKIHKKKK